MTDQPKKKIFLSHTTDDDAMVDKIAKTLTDDGHTVWVDHKHLSVGAPSWDKAIKEAIRDCDIGLFLMSKKSLTSEICEGECQLVKQLGKPLFVVRYEACDPMAIWFTIKQIQYADIVTDFDDGMARLIRALGGETGKDLPTASYPITGRETMNQYLPYLSNPLRGRDADVTALRDSLAHGGVTQLTGVGGLGKSRISAEITLAHPTGAIWHRCSEVSIDADVISQMRSHLRLSPDAPRADVIEKIGGQKSLLVLDNAEDVTTTNRVGYIQLINQLRGYGVPILLTSREKWDDQQPHRLYELMPLTDLAIVVQLTSDFCASFGISLTDEQLSQMATAGRLHPRLIEFAVGQIGNTPYDDVIRRLNSLTHKSIQKALDEMITKTLAQMKATDDDGVNADALIRNLTWLQATFPETVIEALKPASIGDRDTLLDALKKLRNFQFIQYDDTRKRYRLGELVREALGTNPDVFPIYADFYTNRARAIFVDLEDTPELWGDQEGGENEDDIANIKALGGALLRQTHDGADGDLHGAVEFAYVTTRYVTRRMEARAWTWLEMGLRAVQTLRQDDGADERLMEGEALLLGGLGGVYQDLGQIDKALAYMEQSLSLYQKLGNKTAEATILTSIGLVYDALGEKQKAPAYHEGALQLFRAVGDRGGEATTLTNIGAVYSDFGEKQKALEYYEGALQLFRAVGDRRGEAMTLNNIGFVYANLGEKQKALEYYEGALPLYRVVGDRGGEASTLNNIGLVYRALGDNQKALAYYEQALPLFRAVGNRSGEAVTCFNMSRVYQDLGDLNKAIEYVERAIHVTYDLDRNVKTFRNVLMHLKQKRGDADVPPESEPTLEEKTQALLKQLIEIYQARGEDGLRDMLKQNNISNEQIEMLVQAVKQNLG